MQDMMKAYKSYETEEYFKARSNPARLQTAIFMGTRERFFSRPAPTPRGCRPPSTWVRERVLYTTFSITQQFVIRIAAVDEPPTAPRTPGLKYKDAKELLDTVRDMFMVPKPGEGPQGPDQNDPDECPNLWDQHLGCYDLAYFSTDYSDWQNPKLDDSPAAPHNKCKDFANQIRQSVAYRKEDKAVGNVWRTGRRTRR